MHRVEIEMQDISITPIITTDVSDVVAHYLIKNTGEKIFSCFKLTVFLFSKEKYIIQEHTSYEITNLSNGDQIEFKANFKGIPNLVLGIQPYVSISVVACDFIELCLGEIDLPKSPNKITPIPTMVESGLLEVISGSLWLSKPDQIDQVYVQSCILLKSHTQTYLPQIRFNVYLKNEDGQLIGNAGARGEIHSNELLVINGLYGAPKRKFQHVKADVNVQIFKRLTSHILM